MTVVENVTFAISCGVVIVNGNVAFAITGIVVIADGNITFSINGFLFYVGGDGENIEVSIEGWNEFDGAYAFHYSGVDQSNLCKFVFVKCIAMGDKLMIDALPGDRDEDKEPLHLEIRYIVE